MNNKKQYCNKCGDCCRGLSNGFVITIFPSDAHRIATHLRITVNQFIGKYTYLENIEIDYFIIDIHYLKNINGKCMFLSKQNLCDVHSAKPVQCQEWPQIIPGKNEEEVKKYPCILHSAEECVTFSNQLIDEILFKENPYGSTSPPKPEKTIS